MRILLVSLICLTSGCSLFSRKNENHQPRSEDSAYEDQIQPQAVTEPTSQEPSSVNTIPEPAVVDVKETLAPIAEAVSNAGKLEKLNGIAPEIGLRYLRNGNARFLKGHNRKDGQSKKDIERTSTEQKPHSIIYGSSDSRIPPEVIFDQKLGEIFVIRTVDMAYDSSVEASLHYGVEQLGIRNIVILGDENSPSNITNLAKQVIQRSAWLSMRVKSGDVQVTPATYSLKTGKVTF